MRDSQLKILPDAQEFQIFITVFVFFFGQRIGTLAGLAFDTGVGAKDRVGENCL